MKILSKTYSSINGLSWQFHRALINRTFTTNQESGDAANGKKNSDSFESADEFERRIFSGISGNSSSSDSFFQKLDRIEKARGKSSAGFSKSTGNSYQFGDGVDDSFNTLSDGMDGRLKKAATYFAHSEEISKDDFMFRPDVSFPSGRDVPGINYTLRDLDLTKPGIPKTVNRRKEFQTTTAEVLRKADFRNVRFLANFITAAGIIKKRKMTGISAKAQRKVAREIKTARAFGLMPFTTMGQWPFRFGVSMADSDDDYAPAPRRAVIPASEADAREIGDEAGDPYL